MQKKNNWEQLQEVLLLTALSSAAVAVALFATGMVAVELVPILIAALAVGGVTYMLSEPSVEKVAENERKV
ncbi:hypothetical protein [Wolbachia endosymbiont of Madathamugadia hiepei]|uniref:hypothetical protein n=1 Tax=Wolbachia endosymbiont of Madathamugadia hiepei TaxID=1241303 RepID=UPI001FE6312C|nr:hypothetical protein [Wolbachia endosymbiont of Madathamugadia hiepei]